MKRQPRRIERKGCDREFTHGKFFDGELCSSEPFISWKSRSFPTLVRHRPSELEDWELNTLTCGFSTLDCHVQHHTAGFLFTFDLHNSP